MYIDSDSDSTRASYNFTCRSIMQCMESGWKDVEITCEQISKIIIMLSQSAVFRFVFDVSRAEVT